MLTWFLTGSFLVIHQADTTQKHTHNNFYHFTNIHAVRQKIRNKPTSLVILHINDNDDDVD